MGEPPRRRFNRLAGRGKRNSLFTTTDVGPEFRSFASKAADDPRWWSNRADGTWRRITSPGGKAPSDLFEDAPGVVAIQLGLQPDGQHVITGLHLETDGKPLTRRGLRAVPLRDLAGVFDDFPDSVEPPPRIDEPRRPGRRGRSDDFYRQVAELYRAARAADPTRPVQWMAEHEDRDPSTIHRWLADKRTQQHLQGEQ